MPCLYLYWKALFTEMIASCYLSNQHLSYHNVEVSQVKIPVNRKWQGFDFTDNNKAGRYRLLNVGTPCI